MDIPRAAGAACPLAEPAIADPAPGALDPGRTLFLRLRDRMRLYRTRSTDFSDLDLQRIKQELGQVYADVSSKLAPDDFARDLKKLALSRECVTCGRRSECGGCWVKVPGDPFTEDEERVRQLLRKLEGKVLDVGAGEGPYAAELAGSVRAGRATYLGLDPDRGRVELLASRHPWARYRVGTLADLAGEGARFDHVLVLRSYNHLPDPEADLDIAVGLLSPGGTLLVVDNIAFGLVRSREHARRAERGPGLFEHFRNDSSLEAARLFGKYPLSLLERQDVGPATSNQWLLCYQKTTEASA
jgi:hypothetical protein